MMDNEEPKSDRRSRADWYRQEWAVKSGRPTSDVYVPEAIREVDVERENELRRALGTQLLGE